MPAILVPQPNGTQWLATHCGVVVPRGGIQGMGPTRVIKALAYCEGLSLRLEAFRKAGNSSKELYMSIDEFERYESNPRRAREEARATQSARTNRSGFVYLAGGNGSYKIGRSSSLPSRAQFLSTKLPFPVELLHAIRAKNSPNAERFWHDRFAARRGHGEWFGLREADVAEFCSYTEM